jgi:hypothetical protein
LIAGLEVPESGDDLEGAVIGLAAAAALPKYLPVLRAGDDVVDAGTEPANAPVMVVENFPAGDFAPRRGGHSIQRITCVFQSVGKPSTATHQT